MLFCCIFSSHNFCYQIYCGDLGCTSCWTVILTGFGCYRSLLRPRGHASRSTNVLMWLPFHIETVVTELTHTESESEPLCCCFFFYFYKHVSPFWVICFIYFSLNCVLSSSSTKCGSYRSVPTPTSGPTISSLVFLGFYFFVDVTAKPVWVLDRSGYLCGV